jgi:hypothetical protein
VTTLCWIRVCVFGVGCLEVFNLREVYCESLMVFVFWGVGGCTCADVCVVFGCGWLFS